MKSRKARAFWPIFVTILLADCSSKELAVEHLSPPHVPHDVVGSALRFTLAYNEGAAFGIELGPWSRPILVFVAFAMLSVGFRVYRRLTGRDWGVSAALALICGGAAGNLLDRLRGTRGVVDFIDVGSGTLRLWTFNLADVGVMLGASLLAFVLWRRDKAATNPG